MYLTFLFHTTILFIYREDIDVGVEQGIQYRCIGRFKTVR